MSSKSIKKWRVILGGTVIVTIGAFLYMKFWRVDDERAFSLIKPWLEPEGDGQRLSDGFLWIHRQCHENLVDVTPHGMLTRQSAADVNRTGPRTWTFRISETSRWSDDGKSVMADDFVEAFKARASKIKASEFLRIKNVAAETSTANSVINNNVVTVELNGDEDAVLDMAALSSVWLTPLKIKKNTPWSWAAELSGPCDGPFVPRKLNGEFLLTRNQNWRDFKPDFIPLVKVKLDTNASLKSDAQVDQFRKGSLSFVGPGSVLTPGDEHRIAYGNAFLEPRAYYILINPRGALSTERLLALPHYAVNRMELHALSNGLEKLFGMTRLLPLSLQTTDSTGRAVNMPTVSMESVQKARQMLGVKDDSLPVNFIPVPFKKPLTILADGDERMRPIVERVGDRLKANYNMSSTIQQYEDLSKLPPKWDMLFLAVSTADGVYGWAKELARAISVAIPSKSDLARKITSIAKEPSETRISPRGISVALELDALAPFKTVIMPLGQLGHEILIEGGVVDVAVSGRGRVDPDVSRARRIVSHKTQDKKL